MKSFIATATVALISAGSLAAEEIHFRLAQRHFVIVSVLVNGQGPYEFLFDTGSSTSVVERELANELGLKPLGETVIRTATGTERVPIARVDRIDLGSQSARTVLVVSSRLDGVRSLDRGIRGVLGFNFLSRFRYLLDYAGRRLVFENGLGVEGTRLPFDSSGGSIRLTCRGVRWLLDTGATGVVLFDWADLDLHMSPTAVRRVSTIDGHRISRTVWIRRLDIGEESFEHLPASLAPHTGLEGRADGLLPGTLFASIYVDHEQKVLVLNPR